MRLRAISLQILENLKLKLSKFYFGVMYSFTIYLDLRFMYVSNDIFQKQTGSLRSYENCHFSYENLSLAEIRLLFINSNKFLS